jgi:hypothetical protein
MIHYLTDTEFVRQMSDEGLLRVYQAMSSAEGGAEAEALLTEIKRRKLDAPLRAGSQQRVSK